MKGIQVSSTILYQFRLLQPKLKQPKEYHFDKVFGPKTTQEMIFKECNIPFLLDQTVEGYHATLFAYGQTGVGKTYTMEGYDYTETKEGLMPIIRVNHIVKIA